MVGFVDHYREAKELLLDDEDDLHGTDVADAVRSLLQDTYVRIPFGEMKRVDAAGGVAGYQEAVRPPP